MKLLVEIELGGDAMRSLSDAGNALARALDDNRAVAPLPLGGHGVVRDLNDNAVGKWEVV